MADARFSERCKVLTNSGMMTGMMRLTRAAIPPLPLPHSAPRAVCAREIRFEVCVEQILLLVLLELLGMLHPQIRLQDHLDNLHPRRLLALINHERLLVMAVYCSLFLESIYL